MLSTKLNIQQSAIYLLPSFAIHDWINLLGGEAWTQI